MASCIRNLGSGFKADTVPGAGRGAGGTGSINVTVTSGDALTGGASAYTVDAYDSSEHARVQATFDTKAIGAFTISVTGTPPPGEQQKLESCLR